MTEEKIDVTKEFVDADEVLDDMFKRSKPRYVPQTKLRGVRTIEEVVAELCDRCSFLTDRVAMLELQLNKHLKEAHDSQ